MSWYWVFAAFADRDEGGPDDDAIFAALRDEYRGRLLDDATRLEKLWSEFDAPAEVERRALLAAQMMRLTHGLSGSAASFGFPAIGAAARPLDAEMTAAIKDSTEFAASSAAWREPIAHLIALCRATAARPEIVI